MDPIFNDIKVTFQTFPKRILKVPLKAKGPKGLKGPKRAQKDLKGPIWIKNEPKGPKKT